MDSKGLVDKPASSELPLQALNRPEKDGNVCPTMSKTSIKSQIMTQRLFLDGGKNVIRAGSVSMAAGNQVKVDNAQMANILGNKSVWLRRSSDIFVKTTGYERAKSCLDTRDHVTVIGEAGCGKTDHGLNLLRSFMPEFTPCIIDSVSELSSLCDPEVPTLVLVNDMFGTCVFSKVLLKDWLKVLEQLQEYLKTGNLKIIFNSRNYIFLEALPNLVSYRDSLFSEDTIVDLSSDASLLPAEKEELLQVYCSQAGIHLSDDILKYIVQMKTNYGFPLACHRFSKMKSWHNKPVEFFKRPREVFIESVQHFESFDAEKFAVLLLVLLKNGKVNLASLTERDDALKPIGIKEADIPSFVRRRHQIATPLIGSYLTSSSDTLSFRHPTVEDTVAYVAGNVDPLFLIKHCSMRVLFERVRIHNSEGKGSTQPTHADIQDFHVVLSDDYHDALVTRFVSEVQHRNFSLVCLHQVFVNESFVDHFICRLKESKTMSLARLLHQKDPKHKGTLLCWSILNTKAVLCKKLSQTSCSHLQESICEALLVCCATGNSQGVESIMSIVNPTMKKRLEEYPISLRKRVPVKLNEDSNDVETNSIEEDTIFNVACSHGHQNVVKVLLQSGFSVNGHVRSYVGAKMCPLHSCCKGDQVDLLEYLHEQGADLDARDSEGNSPLHMCSDRGYLQPLKKCLDLGACVESKNRKGLTSLSLACESGNFTIVKHLVKHGADVNTTDIVGETPLLIACENGYEKITRYLIDIEVKTDKQKLLTYACKAGCEQIVMNIFKHEDFRMMESPLKENLLLVVSERKKYLQRRELGRYVIAKHLLDLGADVSVLDNSGRTPLLIAAESGLGELVHLFMERGAALHVRDSKHQSLLHKAAKGDLYVTVQALLNDTDSAKSSADSVSGHAAKEANNFDVNDLDDKKKTPLHVAVEADAWETVQVLVHNKANVNAVERYGDTPLHKTCKITYGFYVGTSVTEALLANGADVNVLDSMQRTPLHCAANNDSASGRIVEMLLEKGADVNSLDVNQNTPLHLVATTFNNVIFNNRNKIGVLLKHGADINAVNCHSQTPLHIAAASHKKTENVKTLIDHKACVNAVDRNNQTPLHIAVSPDIFGTAPINAKNVKTLIDNKACVNALDHKNQTPLHFAAGGGYLEGVEMLLEHGADVNTKDMNQQTPLHLAAKHGRSDCVLVLLDHGADISIVDIDGKTPREVAIQSQLGTDTRQLLLDHENQINTTYSTT